MCRFRFQFRFHLWVLALGFMLLISYLAVRFSLSFLRYASLSLCLSRAHTINTHDISTEIGQKVESSRRVASSRWQALPFVFRIISDAQRPHQQPNSPRAQQLSNSPIHRLTDSRLCRWPKLSPHSTRQQCVQRSTFGSVEQHCAASFVFFFWQHLCLSSRYCNEIWQTSCCVDVFLLHSSFNLLFYLLIYYIICNYCKLRQLVAIFAMILILFRPDLRLVWRYLAEIW